MKDRKITEIDRDNFDQVLAGMTPRVAMAVENKMAGDGSKIGVDLKFNSLDDFEPDKVVQQVDPAPKARRGAPAAVRPPLEGRRQREAREDAERRPPERGKPAAAGQLARSLARGAEEGGRQ